MAWRKHKSFGQTQGKHPSSKSFFITGIFCTGAVVLLLILAQIKASVFLSPRTRVTVGVFASTPYVFSYDKDANLAHIAYFDPKIFAYVPGGYSWYKLGSVNLLAAIEHDKSRIIKNTFEQLIGAPVDMVIYPLDSRVLDTAREEDFVSFFLEDRRQYHFFNKKFGIATPTIIDRFLLLEKLQIRPDKLVLAHVEDAYLRQNGQNRYVSSRIDAQLKGFFYQQLFIKSPGNVIIKTKREQYGQARIIARIIEGLGIKVSDIQLEATEVKCKITYPATMEEAGRVLADYFDCPSGVEKADSASTVYFYLDKSHAKLYL